MQVNLPDPPLHEGVLFRELGSPTEFQVSQSWTVKSLVPDPRRLEAS